VVLEPVQNSGGCLPPPPGYFQRVREICDRHDVLLVSDEIVCAFGRQGTVFACEKFGYQPDIVTCAKGMTSGYSPIGAMITTDRVMEPFLAPGVSFAHGYTFGGHPVSAAVALANLDLLEREGLYRHVLDNQSVLQSTLERLLDLPIVGDVRGDGYFWAVALVRDQQTRQTLDADERNLVIRQFLPTALYDAGLYCRPTDRGEPVIQIAPPLICGPREFDEIEQILRSCLTDAWKLM
jgi:adenosylmethionine-8-amino-7-oxononanoate aminotransferase